MEIDTAKDLLNLSILNYRIHEICQDDSKESNQSSMIQINLSNSNWHCIKKKHCGNESANLKISRKENFFVTLGK